MYPENLKYSKEHTWARMDDGIAEVGITVFARDSLGNIVFIDLPEVGTEVQQFAKFGEIESVKAVSDLFSPVGGKIVEVNTGATDNPELVNDDPYNSGWLIKVAVADQSQLEGLMCTCEYESALD